MVTFLDFLIFLTHIRLPLARRNWQTETTLDMNTHHPSKICLKWTSGRKLRKTTIKSLLSITAETSESLFYRHQQRLEKFLGLPKPLGCTWVSSKVSLENQFMALWFYCEVRMTPESRDPILENLGWSSYPGIFPVPHWVSFRGEVDKTPVLSK